MFWLPAYAVETLETSVLSRGFIGDQNQSGFVGFYSEAYGPRPSNASQETVYPALVARAKKELTFSGDSRLHGEGEFSINPSVRSDYYVNVPEAYAEHRFSPAWDGSFGRQKHEWSRLDDVWEQGLWQPRFRWDYFNPEPVGLTGFFSEYQRETFSAVLFATPMYIPEQIATYSLQNGQFHTDHPFFSTPPDQIPLFGQSAPVRYTVADANIAKIVFHPGAGAMARWGAQTGAWVKTSYAYQPMNQIFLGYEGALSLGSGEIDVLLHPRVLDHHLAALEGGYEQKDWQLWASLTGDRPILDTTPGTWTVQEVSPALLAAAGAEATVFGSGTHAARVQASYLQRWAGVRSDQGQLAVANGSLFESRFDEQSAVMVSATTPLTNSYRHQLSARAKGIYDFSVSGALVSGELRYQTAEHWVVTLGGDAVGAVRSQSEAAGGADLFYLYRYNSRVRGSFAYAF